MKNPTRASSTLTALLVATAALGATAAAAAPATATAGADQRSPFGPVTATVAGHVLRGQPAAPGSVPSLAAAPTGSIVFVKGGNVWLTRPDGTGMRQVTTDGSSAAPYEHPTMSTTGTIAVMKGKQILRMAQSGAVLNRMTPADLFVPDYGTVLISPVTDPEISPDGSKIAYSQLRLEHYGGGDYNYNVTESETAVTDATRFTQPTKIYLGFQPGWIGNGRFTLDRSGDVHLADLGQDAKPWYTSDDIFDTRDPLDPFIALNEPEVSPDGQRALFGVQNTGFGMTTTTSSPATGAPGKPTASPQCFLSADTPDVYAEDATFGPDSDSVVYSEGGKLSVIRNLAACNDTTTISVLTTGATEPDWSPAPLAPAGTTGGGTTGGGTTGGGSAHAFRLVTAPVVTGKAKVGKRLTAGHGTWSPTPAGYSFTWLRNGKAVRTGASYRLTRADRGKRIQVRVTVRRAGYAARSAVSRAVKVKR